MSPGTERSHTTVGFQGERGAYSEEAVHGRFGSDAIAVPLPDFDALAGAVIDGEVDFALLPIENAPAGTVEDAYEVLEDPHVRAVAEIIHPIHHCLLGVRGATLDDIVRVMSQPAALAQCRGFFRENPRIEAVAVYDTAGAARAVAESGETDRAAIASRSAADRYGLQVLAEEIQDRKDTFTRFLVLRAMPQDTLPSPLAAGGSEGTPRTLVLCEVPNHPGALMRILAPFAAREINLPRIQSLPGPEAWTYRFLIDVEGDPENGEARAALAEAEGEALRLRIVGRILGTEGIARPT